MRSSPRYYAKQLVAACLEQPKRLGDIVNNFWHMVLADKRFAWRQRIVQEVDDVWQEVTGRSQVKVSSHRPLLPAECDHIMHELIKKYGSNIDFTWEVKPHILGGLVVTVNNEKFDFSLKGTLDSLYYNLAK